MIIFKLMFILFMGMFNIVPSGKKQRNLSIQTQLSSRFPSRMMALMEPFIGKPEEFRNLAQKWEVKELNGNVILRKVPFKKLAAEIHFGDRKITVKTFSPRNFRPKGQPAGTVWTNTLVTMMTLKQCDDGHFEAYMTTKGSFEAKAHVRRSTLNSFMVSLTSLFYGSILDRHHTVKTSEYYVYAEMVKAKIMNDICLDVFGMEWDDVVKTTYPVELDGIKLGLIETMLSPFASKLRHPNPDDMKARARSMFGKRKGNKTVAKALKQAFDDAAFFNIRIAYAFHRKLTSDRIAQVLSAPGILVYAGDKPMVGLLNLVSPNRLVRFLTEDVTNRDITEIEDAMRMFSALKGKITLEFKAAMYNARNWHEIHAACVVAFNMMQTDQHLKTTGGRKIPQTFYKGVEDIVVGTIRIVSAKNERQMIGWGKHMHHCIGSYAMDAVNEVSQFFAIYDNGLMVANIQTYCGRMMQFYGPRNAPVDASVVQAVMSVLYAHNVIDMNSVENWERWVNRALRQQHEDDVWDEMPAGALRDRNAFRPLNEIPRALLTEEGNVVHPWDDNEIPF